MGDEGVHSGGTVAGAPMLLPLTQSLYVEGELEDSKNVLIDIGTGYYLEVHPPPRAPAPGARVRATPSTGTIRSLLI